MTYRVFLVIIGIIMNGISTMTQKGQVAIPKSIRDIFNLKPYDKVYFEVQEGKIVATPVPTIDEMFGLFKTSKRITKKEMKRTIREAVLTKFLKRK